MYMKLHNLRQRCNPLQLIDQFKTLYHTADTTTTEARAHGAAQPRAKVQHTAMHQPLQHTATHCSTLQHTADATKTQARAHGAAEPRAKVQHTAMQCITMRPTLKYATDALHVAAQPRVNCNTLQHTATHYNTLQHTTTHYEGSECRSTTLQMSLYANVAVCKCRCMPMSLYTFAHVAVHLWVAEVASHQLPKRASTNRSLQHTATYCNILQHNTDVPNVAAQLRIKESVNHLLRKH